jgi:hypothetical protein
MRRAFALLLAACSANPMQPLDSGMPDDAGQDAGQDAGSPPVDAGVCRPDAITHLDAGPQIASTASACARDLDCDAGMYCYAPFQRCVKPSTVGFADGNGKGGLLGDGSGCYPLVADAVCDATSLDWADSFDVSREAGSLVESDTVLAADGHGTLVAAWAQVPVKPRKVSQRNRLAVSHDDGAHFTILDAPVDDGGSASNDAVLAYDGQYFYAWESYDNDFAGAQRIWLATSPNGDAWSLPISVNTPGDFVSGGALDFPWISINPIDHQPWITYQSVTQTSAFEKLVRFVDGGVTPSVELDDGARASPYRDLAVHAFDESGRFYAAWLEVNDFAATKMGGVLTGSIKNEIRFTRFDNGIRAGPDVKVSSATDEVLFEKPAIAVAPDGAFVYVAWVAGRFDATRVRIAVSADHGSTFSAPMDVSVAGCATEFHETLALDANGRLYAFWYDNRDAEGHLLYAVSDDHAATFHAPRLVSAPAFPFSTLQYATGWLGDYFQPAVTASTLYVLWSDGREGDQSHAFFTKASLP